MDIKTKIEKINIILIRNGYTGNIITDKEVINVVYDLLINDIIPVATDNTEVIRYIAVYYEIKKDTENQIKYYLMAIDKKDSISMNNLARHYEDQKDYENMIKYYLMAIEEKYSIAMNNLSLYYKGQKDYENMKKYYLMAIEQGNAIAMNNLGYYYHEQKDYVNMLKYYLMAIEEEESSAMSNLGFYYREQKDYENMIKYYLMAIKNGHISALESLTNYFMENNKEKGLYVLYDLCEGVPNADTKLMELLRVVDDKSLLSYIKYITNINHDLKKCNTEIMDLKRYVTELELAPEGPKYKEAKEHFELLSTMKMN
jgi:TPR repeat protein